MLAGVVAIGVAAAALFSASDSNPVSAFGSGTSAQDQKFLDAVAKAGFDVPLSDSEQVQLAMDACALPEGTWRNEGNGSGVLDAVDLVYSRTGLTGGDGTRYWNIAARNYCPRWSPPHS